MNSDYYKKCSRCHRYKNVLGFFKNSGKETKACEECREKCAKRQLDYLERKRKEFNCDNDHFNETLIKELTDRIYELLPIINELNK